LHRPNILGQLIDAELDVAIDPPPEQKHSQIHSEALFQSHFACVMRPDNPLATEALTLQAFVAADHLLVSLSGDAIGFVDAKLRPLGLKRRVAMTVDHFSLVPRILEGSDLISVVPYGTIAESACRGELWATRPPIDISPVTVSMLWHKRNERNADQRWLRDRIRTATQKTLRTLPTPDCVRRDQAEA